MTYIIAEPCIGIKDTACVEVCPVDCIHPTKTHAQYDQCEQLFINPDDCINCGACAMACPVGAIFEEDELPVHLQDYKEKNRDFFKTFKP